MKKRRSKNNDWLKPRGYVHFTSKINTREVETIKFLYSFISNPNNISSHGFYPLIYNAIIARRYKDVGIDEYGDTIKGHYKVVNGSKESTAKKRNIFYATHLDALIYSYYTQKILAPLYENILLENPGLGDCISAYRKVPVEDDDSNKNNIHFANDVFKHIKARGECVAMCFDVSSFFDSLNHKYLKKQWCKLLNVTSLPDDHYNLYTSLTDFSYVSLKHVMKEFGFNNRHQLKNRDVISFCASPEEFRNRIVSKKYVRPHKFKKEGKRLGIPQGTPISAFLSNLYLLEFDIRLYQLLKKVDGFYRRYSDDIIIVCDKELADKIKSYVIKLISNEDFKLNINEEKVETSNFSLSNNILSCDVPLRYLGFEFDGKTIKIKSASLAKYYRSLKKGVKAQAKKARHSLREKGRRKQVSKHGMIFKRKIFSRYSHLGSKSSKRNFYLYAKDASRIMGEKAISGQVSRSWKILTTQIDKYEKKYFLSNDKKNND